MTTDAVAIDTAPVDLRAAAAIEAAEARAWADMYAAAPADWAASVGLGSREIGGALVLSWATTARRYFSRAIGLGVGRPTTEGALDEILEGYREAGITMFLLQSLPHCRPAGYEGWLRERGLEPFDVQDRVVRDGRRPAWRQYVAREGGEIVAARGMTSAPTAPPGSAWTVPSPG